MKKKILLLSFLLVTILNYSQDDKISLEINYPLTFSDDYSKDYKGIIDLGVKYRVFNLKKINLGLSFNYTITKWEETFNPGFLINGVPVAGSEIKVIDNIYQPKIFMEIKLNSIKKLKPLIEIGYTFSSKKETNVIVNPDKLEGFNLNLGASYDFTNRFFTQIKYNHIAYNKVELQFFEQTRILKVRSNFIMIGIGYRL